VGKKSQKRRGRTVCGGKFWGAGEGTWDALDGKEKAGSGIAYGGLLKRERDLTGRN